MRIWRGLGRAVKSSPCLVELHRGAPDRPPLFVVCWAGGKLVSYRHLIPLFPADQPIYGLRTPRFDGRTFLYSSLQDLARLFLAEVRRFRPEGPYLFGGYCFGGTVAHEIVSQLEAEGETALFLGLIESFPYGHGWPRPPRWTPMRRRRFILGRFFQSGATKKLSMLYGHVFGRWGRPRRTLRRVLYRVACRTGWRWPGMLCNLNMLVIKEQILRYVVPASSARITLFLPHDPAREQERESMTRFADEWSRLARGGVDVHLVSGHGIDHVSIMREPHVAQLSQRFVECLDAALGSAGGLAVD